MKRIPRIKFPQRHQSSSSGSTSQKTGENTPNIINSRSSSDVPAAPINAAMGGQASLQPSRTPVSDKEIEAILLGGCI